VPFVALQAKQGILAAGIPGVIHDRVELDLPLTPPRKAG
jgi:hypothetical protein